MRTSETLLLDFIRQSPQFRIPVNQRRYAWTRRHCRQLWDDILDAGERQDVREHFLGPIMYVAAVDPLNAHWAPCLVYDGQQRLTTITLILKTLSRHLKDDTAPDGFGPDQIRNASISSTPSARVTSTTAWCSRRGMRRRCWR